MEVVVVDDLAEALRDGLEVAPGEPAVGREALGQDEHVATRLGERVVVEREPAADVGEPVLLGAHRHPVGERGHVADDVRDRPVRLAGLAGLDEPGVLGEPAGVEEERLPVPVADGPDGPQVLERDRLAAARVVGHGHEHDRDVRAARGQQRLERVGVHVALERMERGRVAALGDDEVDRLGAGRLDVGAGGVEVGVVRDDLARPADDREQDLLGGPALVGRDDVAERPQLLDRLEEREPRRRAGVRLVAVLDGRPLVAAHGAGPRVGQQVDQDVLGVEREQVQPGRLDGGLALGAGRDADGLDGVDAEGLDDGPEAGHRPSIAASRVRWTSRRTDSITRSGRSTWMTWPAPHAVVHVTSPGDSDS